MSMLKNHVSCFLVLIALQNFSKYKELYFLLLIQQVRKQKRNCHVENQSLQLSDDQWLSKKNTKKGAMILRLRYTV